MTPPDLVAFVRRHSLAVEAAVSPAGAPQAAVVGIVVNDALEVFFDTLASSRKCENLRRHPRVALVIGWDLDEGCTVQLEGVADEPSGADLAAWKQLYCARFPDGVARATWPGITYFRVRSTWARHSDFRGSEPAIVEFDATALATLRTPPTVPPPDGGGGTVV